MSEATELHPEVGDNRLAVLAAEIRIAHAGVVEAARTAAERAIEAGKVLIEAKALVQHGQWLPWLKQHCHISERTAQLYMKIVGLELKSATVADLGLRAAGNAVAVIEDASYDPFANCDEEQQRQWLLFTLWGIHPRHVEWILQRQYTSPDEWLGVEGAQFRRHWGLPQMSDACLRSWAAFQHKHQHKPRAEIEAELTAHYAEADEPQPRKRRRRLAA